MGKINKLRKRENMKQTFYTKLLTAGTLLCMLPLLVSAESINTKSNISPVIQSKVESMLKQMTTSLDADEIIVGVMESKTGKVLSLAGSKSHNASSIAEYPYEPGSVMKPITLALALDSNVVTAQTWFKTYSGKMTMAEGRSITDDEKFEELTATDIIVYSSNIGISQISWLLTGEEFREGLVKFGFSKPSGIDLDGDSSGHIKALHFLNNKTHRANTSYGYGMHATFAQLLKAYSVFNNDGIVVTPHVGKNNSSVTNTHVISEKSANKVHDILVEVVKRGTGVHAQYAGLEIGGKTGTAHMVKDNKYINEYNSSFYGFANDKLGHKYTIGVLVIRAKAHQKYFASQSAVPTFRKVVEILVDEGKLKVAEKQ